MSEPLPQHSATESCSCTTEGASTANEACYILLYDGDCGLCVNQSARLVRWMARVDVTRINFRDEGVLDNFAEIDIESCEKAMHLITPDGKRFAGCEAIARALSTRRITGVFAFVYYLPIVKQLCDYVYRWIARNRFRLNNSNDSNCKSSSCCIHSDK